MGQQFEEGTAGRDPTEARHDDGHPGCEGGGRILLVEDEASLRTVTKRILAKNGYEVVEASNGLEALQELESGGRGFDLVLTDVVMPIMSGIDLADHLAELLPSLKVAYMTGSSGVLADVHESEPPLIRKPFNQAQLLAKVREVIEGSAKDQILRARRAEMA